MQNIALLPLTADTNTTQEIFNRLNILDDCKAQIIKQATRFSPGDVLLVIIDEDWQTTLDTHPIYKSVLVQALPRNDLLILNLILGDTTLPMVTTLPDTLQILPYLSTIHINSHDTLQRDMRQVIIQIATYSREQTIGGKHSPQNRPAQRGTLPTNLILILTVLSIAMILLIATRLRKNNEPESTPLPTPETIAAEQITIGVAAGFSKGAEERGFEIVNGVELALRQRPEITIGEDTFPIDLVTQDTLCSASGSISVARTFASDSSLIGIIGHQCDTGCSAAAPIYDSVNLTMISPSCTLPQLQNYKSFMRTLPAADYIAIPSASIVWQKLKIDRLTIIHDEIILGGKLARLFQATFENQTGQVVGFHSIETTSANIHNLAEMIRSEDTQLIYYAGRPMNAARLRVLLPDVPFILADPSGIENYIEETGNFAEGTYTITLLPPQDEMFIALHDNYTSLYGSSSVSSTFAYAYDATNILLDSIETSSEVNEIGQIILNRKKLRDTMQAYKDTGVTGSLNCIHAGNCAGATAQLWVIRAGKLMEINLDG